MTSNIENIPYGSDRRNDILLSLNDPATSFSLNKIFLRLIQNDKFLDFYKAKYNSLPSINLFDPTISYSIGDLVWFNLYSEMSDKNSGKLVVLRSIRNSNQGNLPNKDTIAPYEYDETDSNNQYFWKYDWYLPVEGTEEYEKFKVLLKRLPIEEEKIPQLSESLTNDHFDTEGVSYSKNDIDYVVKSGYSVTPCVIDTANTNWPKYSVMEGFSGIETYSCSWYRIYKSGFVEQGGITEPFSLTKHWNEDSAKSIFKIKFPQKISCINASYSLVGNLENFMTEFDEAYSTKSLMMYQITEGTRSSKNYKYPDLAGNPDSNVRNSILFIDNDSISILLSHCTYNLSNNDDGKTDATVSRLSWIVRGILVD